MILKIKLKDNKKTSLTELMTLCVYFLLLYSYVYNISLYQNEPANVCSRLLIFSYLKKERKHVSYIKYNI